MTELLLDPPKSSLPPPSPSHDSARTAAAVRIQRKKCRTETWSTFASLLLPTLRTKLEAETKLSSLTKSLKKLRKRRQALETAAGDDDVSGDDVRSRNREEAFIWKKIQEKTVTRTVSTVYAHAFLFLVLWVQVHVLGGRLHPQRENGTAEGDGPSDGFEPHRTALTQTFRAFFDDGIPRLVRAVEAIVEAELRGWNVIVDEEEDGDGGGTGTAASETPTTTTLGCVSAEDLEDVIRRIRSSFETDVVDGFVDGGKDVPSGSFPVSLFAAATTDSTGDTTRHILDETWDLMESPIWKEVESECVDASFDILRDGGGRSRGDDRLPDEDVSTEEGGWNKLFAPKSHPDSAAWSGNGDDASRHAGAVIESVPLAYILTQLKKITHNSFYTRVGSCPNIFVRDIDNLSSLNELGDASFNSYY